MKWNFRASLVLVFIFIAASSLAQTTEPPANSKASQRANRTTKITLQSFDRAEVDMDIDGSMSEPVWRGIEPITDFRVINPDTLEPAPYKTETRVFFTDRGLYVGVTMEQPKESLIQRISGRDNISINRDTVTITVDTSGDGLFGYWMMLALGDNQSDGTVLPERQYAREWDGAWFGKTEETESGWSAEFFMPWGQMAMPRETGVREIGLNVTREVAFLNQSWAWPGIPESEPNFMSDLPLLQLDGVSPRQQWSLYPYATTNYDGVDNTAEVNGGFDIFWRPSSNFQLTGTVNPDFGAVESDDVVVNLTAVEVFFPERRLFFQEGQEIFNTTPRSTGSNGKRLSVINTRRIGARPRSPDLPEGVRLPTRERIRPADLDGSLKLTGQAGPMRYGFLTAVEAESEFAVGNQRFFQEGRDFSAFRLLYENSTGSAAYRGLGYLGTLVAHPESDAEVHAVDWHYRSNGAKWNIDGQFIATNTDDVGSDNGVFTDIVYTPRQGRSHSVQLSYFGDDFYVNDFGFQERNGVREIIYRFNLVESGFKRFRDVRMSTFLRYEENLEGDRTNNAIPVTNATITLNNLDRINAGLFYFPERYDDLNSFGNGTYRVQERLNYSLGYTTNTAKEWSYNIDAAVNGEFQGGRNFQYTTGVTWQPKDNIRLSGEVIHNDRDGWLIHQEDQNFTAFQANQWRTNLNFDYFLTAKQQFRMVLQWVGIKAVGDEFYFLPADAPTNNRDLLRVPKPPGPSDDFSISQLNFQLRYRWQIAPLSDLFVVYTKGDSRRASLNDFDNLFQDSWDNPLGDVLSVLLRYRLGT